MTSQRELFDEIIATSTRRRLSRLRWRKFGAVIGRLLAAYIEGAIFALLNGWMLMLAVGVAHDEWIHQLPTIGYWWAVLLVYLLRGVFSSQRPTSKDKS